MRFRKAFIDAYGRFSGVTLELSPGLQIVSGPNEHGKSTLRHFLSDMLYGQKRSRTQRVYDESNRIREPWGLDGEYGGRIDYVLDSGREIEVQRSFSRKREWIKVFDLTDGKEITNEFRMLRNRESTFAEHHLGMGKEVFLGMATISHVTLDGLGDDEALAKIREKLVSITDTGTERNSGEAALRYLQDRIARIGQPSARTRPLPMARAKLMALQQEYDQVLRVRKELESIEADRLAAAEALDKIVRRKQAIERELELHGVFRRRELLARVEALHGRLATITRRCFELNDVGEFDHGRAAEVRRLAALLESGEGKLGRMEHELEAMRTSLAQEIQRLGPAGAVDMPELDPEYESQLADLEARIRRLSDRAAEITETLELARSRYAEAQSELAQLPDFTQISSDPVSLFTQLAASFDVALRAREDEQRKQQALEQLVAKRERALAPAAALFADIGDFPELVRRYGESVRYHAAKIETLRSEEDGLRGRLEELSGRVPAFLAFALVFLFGAIASAGTAAVVGNTGIYVTSACCVLGLIFCLGYVVRTRSRQRGLSRRHDAVRESIADLQISDSQARQPVESIMALAGLETARELEAEYERYTQNKAELALLHQQLKEQDAAAHDAAERAARLFQRLRGTFAAAKEHVEAERDVHVAATRAIGRYQEFRDAKRRALEGRQAFERRESELKSLQSELEGLRGQELELSLEVRRILRENHYPDEQKADSALKALRGYRIRSAQHRQKRSHIQVLEGNIRLAENQLEQERAAHEMQRRALAQALGRAGAATLEEYEAVAARAQEYQDLKRERAGIEAQIEALLGPMSLEALREEVESDEPLESAPANSESALKRDLAAAEEALDAQRQELHRLQLLIAGRAAGYRSLNEVDEERAATERQVRALELELQAASYAASIIEEATRERHARIAPQLAELAGAYMSEITGGAYKELLINKDLQISVRIPQTKSLNSDPEKRLSKGTVDQIYLALRLAMVQCLNESGEHVPMLLDDPFANYDDERLDRAMRLLARAAERNQILLFTCRQDVVRAAKRIHAPILEL